MVASPSFFLEMASTTFSSLQEMLSIFLLKRWWYRFLHAKKITHLWVQQLPPLAKTVVWYGTSLTKEAVASSSSMATKKVEFFNTMVNLLCEGGGYSCSPNGLSKYNGKISFEMEVARSTEGSRTWVSKDPVIRRNTPEFGKKITYVIRKISLYTRPLDNQKLYAWSRKKGKEVK